jgi:hypothetical protein
VTALNFTRILSNGSSSSTLFLTGKRKKLDNVLIDQINSMRLMFANFTVVIIHWDIYDDMMMMGSVAAILLCRCCCCVVVVPSSMYNCSSCSGDRYSNVEAS